MADLADCLENNDYICLSCNINTQDGGMRVALAAEGFGNRKCFTEPLQEKNPEPPDLSICAFVLEQALSVRALQEMINAPQAEQTSQAGSRTLLYGHAVLLRHCHSDMYLSCLTTSSSNDKLAFDVGLTSTAEGESCWWTIHPASKQRSEGEKVRVGDDFILVSVSSERYLHIGGSPASACVIASFQQTLWTVVPVSAGSIRQKSLGYVFGGDVLRFFHGDECLTLPEAGSENIFESVVYETGAVCSQARSLWRVQHVRMKWYAGFIGCGRPVRIRHVTSGRYLGITPENKLVTLYRLEANGDETIFWLGESKDDKKQIEEEAEEGMGPPEIKYGDSVIVVQHAQTGLWLSYKTYETKKKGIGRVEVKQAVMLEEGHMDDGIAFTRAQDEESRSALVIRKCTSLFTKFINGLASLKDSVDGRNEVWSKVSLEEVLRCLQDLIEFFAQPSDSVSYEQKQKKLHALRNRQNLFQEEGMIALVLDTIDQFSVYKSPRQFANYAGEEAAILYEDISSYLYLLLASMIQGNRANCAQFAQVSRLDWLVDRLQSQQASTGVLKVLHCVLVDSPEALTMIKEQHIQTIISLLDKQGRDPKVLEVLCALCVGNDVAVRSNQNLICDNLLPSRDLLLQTKVVDTVTSMRPNIYIGLNEGAAMYKRWYYELAIDHVEMSGVSTPHLRVGWANVEGYRAYPASGTRWGCNGVGDDLYSYAFDGVALWTGGKRKQIRSNDTHVLTKGDVVGCCLDLSIPAISFYMNGVQLKAVLKDFNMTGMFFPVVSMSSKVSCRFMLGGEHGKIKHAPPEGYAPVFESLLPKEKLKIEPCFNLGDINRGIIYGPSYVGEHQVFVPNPVDTSHVQLPSYIESVRDKLAENIHELWALGKIEQGWSFGEYRDDASIKHPCLTTFERLPASERQYDITLAFETLRTLLALGYHISVDNVDPARRMKYQKLPAAHMQTNGYKPMPLDLVGIQLNDKLEELVDQLAENTHNVWARDRIRQGWTYGQCDDTENKRSCHLVPYNKVDANIKKANRETASETIRTLLAYGYSVEAPNPEAQGLARHISDLKTQSRILRPSRNYAVTTGKWYFEFEMLTAGLMRVGWAKKDIEPLFSIGESSESYVFDGLVARKWHGGAVPYGKTWQVGDIIGCFLDMPNRTITFSMNGELMMDLTGQEIAYKEIDEAEYLPIIMLGPDQRAKVNYGQDPNSLKYYTVCGLQEGYEPFCINMTRAMPMWYVRSEGSFIDPLTKPECDVAVTKVQKSLSNCPAIKVSSKTFGTLGAKTSMQFLRMSLPVKCNDRYIATKPVSSPGPSESAISPGSAGDMMNDRGGAGAFRHPSGPDYLDAFESNPHALKHLMSINVPTDVVAKGLTLAESRGSSVEKSIAAAISKSLHEDTSDDKMLKGLARGSSVDDPMTSDQTDMGNADTGSKTATLDVKGKSRFHFFKKTKSRDPSPASRSAAKDSTDMYITAPPDVVPTSGRAHPMLSKNMSEQSYGSDSIDLSAVELQELENNIDVIDTYYFGLRLLPGQDPSSVYVGWFTNSYSRPDFEFSPKSVRHVNLGALESSNNIKTSISRREMYMVHVGELVHKFGAHEAMAGSTVGRDAAGILVGCFLNITNGFLSFTLNGRDLPNKFQVEPGTRLFPAVIYEPTCQDNLLFEIGRTRSALPISSVMFRGGKQIEPMCPSRLDIQILTPSSWSRAPNHYVKVHRMKLSDVKGWSMLTEEPVGMLSVHIPEEDRSLDILELSEIESLLKFHEKSLELYCALCSHGNFRAAHEIIKHVNEQQLMTSIQENYLDGNLRMGFHELLIKVHLQIHSKIRLLTEKEYLFPLRTGEPDHVIPLWREDTSEKDPVIMKTVPSSQSTISIRPKLAITEQELEFLRFASVPQLSSPLIPLETLKKIMMRALLDAVNNGGVHVRDPIGGTNSNLFVPILKVIDHLLVMGLVNDTEIRQLLRLIDPVTFGDIQDGQGLLQMNLSEPVKVQLCFIFHHLCDIQVRHRCESLYTFSMDFVHKIQVGQLSRYQDITASVMSPATAAKRTKEFRSSPREQMRTIINFNFEQPEAEVDAPIDPELKEKLSEFHQHLTQHCRLFEEELESAADDDPNKSFILSLLGVGGASSGNVSQSGGGDESEIPADTMQKLIATTMVKWSRDSQISSHELVRQMFSLLYRQYDALGELLRALEKTYTIGEKSIEDLYLLMKPLCNIRALLSVQVGPHEEEILKNSLKEIMDNKIFFQHPDLMKLLCVHETSMQLMVATLNKSQQDAQGESDSSEMVVMCCKFLCYFCRISRKNQQAMFEHLGYLLGNSSMLLVRPSLRGSCPLDVAYSSLMDNNELALALRESHLEKIIQYLSRAGVQSNPDLVSAGYPDIGWDPVEGERFLDFLRFCVWVNGESVEENANLVVRLLIRRPECLGPALRGESGGGGLLKAMKSGIIMSEQIAAARDATSSNFLVAMGGNSGKPYLTHCKYDLSMLPSEEDEDYIDMGSAILTFYSTLVDLLGRCAPSEETIKSGRSDSVRARSILRSLVSMADLEGILSLNFMLPEASKPDSVPPGLTPEHKSAMVMFLERVYGIDTQEIFFRMIENGFLADLRTSTTLDTSGAAESDFALALNRYLCGSVLPLLTKHAQYFSNAEHKSQLMDSLLHTVYRLSKCKSLTAGQFRTVTDFLIAHTSNMRPIMMIKLLNMLTADLPALTENTVISLRMLTHHYERCTTYYSSGHPEFGIANDDEKRLTMILFTCLFDALAQRSYEPELFSRALPCLAAIGCALSPDCSVTSNEDLQLSAPADDNYIPRPVDGRKISIPSNVAGLIERFAEHYHDVWSSQLVADGWQYGDFYDEEDRLHPNLLDYLSLRPLEQKKLTEPAEDIIKALTVWGWQISFSGSSSGQRVGGSKQHALGTSTGSYSPSPIDLKNVSLSREILGLVDRVAENQHAAWAKKKRGTLDGLGGGVHPLLVPYDMLTVTEKELYRVQIVELFKFMQANGYRINSSSGASTQRSDKQQLRSAIRSTQLTNGNTYRAPVSEDEDSEAPKTEKRFAFSLLEKLLEYVDKAATHMIVIQSSKHFTKTDSFNDQSEEIKFFGKVVLPLMNKYFAAHQTYFMGVGTNAAATKEKEMVASLFCKLSSLLRQKLYAFGSDIHITVQCLVCICQAVDARSVVKNSADIVRTQLTPLFMNAAEDLTTLVENLKAGRFSHIKGTLAKGNHSIDYIHMVVLPVLSALFNHLAIYKFGPELLVNDIQLACYRILHGLYTIGAHSVDFVQREQITGDINRHRPALGECVAAFAACFPVAFLEPQFNITNRYSIVYQVPVDEVQEHSLEAHEIMTQLSESMPSLDKIADIIKNLTNQPDDNESMSVIEVTLPMLCSYLPVWWSQGPNGPAPPASPVTTVTSELMNSVLGDVLALIQKNIGKEEAPWMNRIASRTQAILTNATPSMLNDYIIPMAEKLCQRAAELRAMEEEYCNVKRNNSENAADLEEELTANFQIMVRDLYATYPVLIRYVDLYRSGWIKEPNQDAERLFDNVAKVFNFWSSSNLFRRAETTFVNINEIDNMALIMPSQKSSCAPQMARDEKKKTKKKGRRKESFISLVVAAIKRLLPIGLNVITGPEQELVQLAKEKMIKLLRDDIKEPEVDIEELIKSSVSADSKGLDPKNRWQKALYMKMGKTKPSIAEVVTNLMSQEKLIEKIMTTAKVLFGLHMVEHPINGLYGSWKKVISTQRKKAVMACFRMIPLHNLHRHRAINLFLSAYSDLWLGRLEWNQAKLIEDLTVNDGEHLSGEEAEQPEADSTPDPLNQFIQALSRQAQADQSTGPIAEDELYMEYCKIMAQSCSGEDEEGEDDEEGETLSFQEQEMQKQKLLFEQGRLSNRAASEMLLLYISASKGVPGPMVSTTIDCGIALLLGGNVDVQRRMLEHLQEKKDVGFFTAVSGFMRQCSVLDLDAFERTNKAESLGVVSADSDSQSGENLHDADFTCRLFRFLQLLCEGHNADWQNYLRTQVGNNTTVNIIISTVDYLLRIQESMMDFYWHYSGKDTIDDAGKMNFIRAITVGKQVFQTLTEYIQGPCQGNQLTLAHSRLWDAVGGFLFIFAHMQDKLSRDPEQLELLREFMNLQKEMMIMLLSMLEGNVVNGPIGKQMVDTLVESSANFEMILKFFDIFLKMKDMTSSEAFLEYDLNKDGFISPKEFRLAMQHQKIYAREEIEYIMMCVDANQDGKVDFIEFTERFHNPAKDIGFNVALLLTNLAEHMLGDSRLERFLEKAKSVLDYFEMYLGRIEIMGSASRIERVYFEITQSHIDQWEKPQIKDSKRSFLHNIVNDEGENEKIGSFVNFCEDTIFEMQHATSISAEEQDLRMAHAKALRAQAGIADQVSTTTMMWEGTKTGFSMLWTGLFYLLSLFTISNIKSTYHTLRSMTVGQIITTGAAKCVTGVVLVIKAFITVIVTFFKWILAMMMGEPQTHVTEERMHCLPAPESPPAPEAVHPAATEHNDLNNRSDEKSNQANGVTSEQTETSTEYLLEQELQAQTPIIDAPQIVTAENIESPGVPSNPEAAIDKKEEQQLPDAQFDYGKYIISLFARNFYNFKLAALGMAFIMNFLLLFYRVQTMMVEVTDEEAAAMEEESEECEVEEMIAMQESDSYLHLSLQILAVIHSLTALSMLIAYYYLKVPLVIFKREKGIARKLEFEGMWIAEEPASDELGLLWDRHVLSTRSFPVYYWDKFVKKKVRSKYSEQFDPEEIDALLNIEKSAVTAASFEPEVRKAHNGILPEFLCDVDWKYEVWKWGVIITDNNFLYLSMYLLFSLIGNYNHFFFAAHLMDVAFSIKTLGTILQSVTHNGKQLVLTVMLTSVVVYIYAVLAFNFFRKFYVQEGEDGEGSKFKCNDLLTCFVFHLHTGVRAGGGIGDEIESADGDPVEVLRILFDITFFFFVIVILLAIIQGLIIDAFGELRSQLEQVKEDMESKCFICGIGKEYFDEQAHGFEKHVMKEHNFANYMFFLMHLINKPDTEYTGQESYVWEMYNNRCWDFFPVGDCFRKQYESEESSS